MIRLTTAHHGKTIQIQWLRGAQQGQVHNLWKVLDVDKTITDSEGHYTDVYEPWLRDYTFRYSLPWDLVLQPHQDFAHRTEVQDIAFLIPGVAEAMRKRGERCPVAPGRQTREAMDVFRKGVLELENSMRFLPGVTEGLMELAMMPGLLRSAHTDCPRWLAFWRLRLVLRYFNGGLIGIAPRLPDLPADSPYRRHLQECYAWTRQVEAAVTAQNLRFVMSVHQSLAKPSPIPLDLAMSLAPPDIRPRVVISAGDNPEKEGRAAKALGEENATGLEAVHFVYTPYNGQGGNGHAVPHDVPVAATVQRFDELPSIVEQLVA